MYQSVELEITDRLKNTNELIRHISNLENDNQNSDLIKIQKGYLFVSLYSSIEYTITNVVSKYLEVLAQEQLKPMEYKKYLLCAVLDSKFNALIGSGKRKLWDRKKEFFDALFSDSPADIDDSVFPTDGINISIKQLQDIWIIFHLDGQAVPDGFNAWVLNEIKEHRNAIAHGREKAADIGGRYTTETLKRRVKDIEALCFHIVLCFKENSNIKAYRYTGSV